jgi:hypothetical protein
MYGSALNPTLKGSLALFVSLLLLFPISPAWIFPTVCAALFLTHLLPTKKLYIFFGANFVSWFSLPFVWGTIQNLSLFSAYKTNLAWFLFSLFCLLLLWIWAILLIQLRRPYLAASIAILTYFLPLLAQLVFIEKDSVLSQVLSVYLIVLRPFYLFAAFALIAYSLSFRERLCILFSAFPFWSGVSAIVFVPVGAWLSGADWMRGGDRNKISAGQISGLKLLLLSYLALFIHYFIRVVIFGENLEQEAFSWLGVFSQLPSLNLGSMEQGFAQAAIVQQHAWERWVALISFFLQGYLRIAFNLGFAVAIARLAGFELPANFNYPWRARSFVNFFGRLLFYYNQVLMQIFYPLVKSLLFPIKNKRFKIGAALFLSISFGGFLFHLGSDSALPDLFQSSEDFFSYARSFLYFSLVALLITFSTLNRKKAASMGPIVHSLKIALYLVTWSLVLSFSAATRHSDSSWSDMGSYLLGLIPNFL